MIKFLGYIFILGVGLPGFATAEDGCASICGFDGIPFSKISFADFDSDNKPNPAISKKLGLFDSRVDKITTCDFGDGIAQVTEFKNGKI